MLLSYNDIKKIVLEQQICVLLSSSMFLESYNNYFDLRFQNYTYFFVLYLLIYQWPMPFEKSIGYL